MRKQAVVASSITFIVWAAGVSESAAIFGANSQDRNGHDIFISKQSCMVLVA